MHCVHGRRWVQAVLSCPPEPCAQLPLFVPLPRPSLASSSGLHSHDLGRVPCLGGSCCLYVPVGSAARTPGWLLTGSLVLYQTCGFVHSHERCLLWPSKQNIAFLLTTLTLFENLFHHLFLTAYLNSAAFLHILYDPDKSISWFLLSIPFRYPLLEKME